MNVDIGQTHTTVLKHAAIIAIALTIHIGQIAPQILLLQARVSLIKKSNISIILNV